mgnify:CR=1 FL=1
MSIMKYYMVVLLPKKLVISWKLDTNLTLLIYFGCRETKIQGVLVENGSFNPPTYMHLHMFGNNMAINSSNSNIMSDIHLNTICWNGRQKYWIINISFTSHRWVSLWITLVFQHIITFLTSLKSRLKAYTPFIHRRYIDTKILKALYKLYMFSLVYKHRVLVKIGWFTLPLFLFYPHLQLVYYFGKILLMLQVNVATFF